MIHPSLSDHPALVALVSQFRSDVRALGFDVNVSTRWGIASVLIALHRSPGFLGPVIARGAR